MFIFSQKKIKNKKCNIDLELDFPHDKKGGNNLKFLIFMASAQKIIDQELAQFGWVESIATNSISDFKSPKVVVEEESDLIDKFVCHLIFYVLFCFSLLIYIFVDLGFASFLNNLVDVLHKIHRKNELIPSSLL